MTDLVDLVDTPAQGGQDDQEADRGDDQAQYVATVYVIRFGAGGLDPAARRGQGTQPEGEQRGQSGPGEQAEHQDLPECGKVDPGHLWFPCRSGRGRGLGFGGSDPSGPFVVHVVVVDLGGTGPPVDGPGEADEDGQQDDHADAAADPVGEPVREGADDPGG